MDWQAANDVTPTPDEVECFALALEGQHGIYAASVADFFAAMHGDRGDAGRAWAWHGVAALVRYRTKLRRNDAVEDDGVSPPLH
jgi:hypothetical protein